MTVLIDSFLVLFLVISGFTFIRKMFTELDKHLKTRLDEAANTYHLVVPDVLLILLTMITTIAFVGGVGWLALTIIRETLFS